jgi:predicted esterase
MDIQRQFLSGDGFHVPAVTLMPPDPPGAVLIIHGYGGSKEEFMGLAWRVSEMGLATSPVISRAKSSVSRLRMSAARARIAARS